MNDEYSQQRLLLVEWAARTTDDDHDDAAGDDGDNPLFQATRLSTKSLILQLQLHYDFICGVGCVVGAGVFLPRPSCFLLSRLELSDDFLPPLARKQE